MNYIRVLILLYFLKISFCVTSQIQANEWCPKGTWWAYTEQFDNWYKDRGYKIFVYIGDTNINNTKTKKMNVYYTGIEMVSKGNTYLDSILYNPKYYGVAYMQNKNDSIFIRYDNFFLDSLGNPDTFTRDFIFSYKIKFKVDECVRYQDTIAKFCLNGQYVIMNDSLCVKKISIDTFINKNGKQCVLKNYNLYFKKNWYMNYDNIIHNVAPLYKHDYAFNIDTLYKVYNPSFKDSIFCDINFSMGSYKYFPERLEQLMCYHQGGEGFLIDDYPNGNYPSGCGYLKLAVDKSTIKNPLLINRYTLYPNPFVDYVIIENYNMTPIQVVIQDINGKLLKKEILLDNINKIFLTSIPSGIYIFYILDKNGQTLNCQKITKL